MYRRILVPLDGSQLAEQVLPHVEALARAFGASVMLVRVVTPPEGYAAAAGGPGVAGVPVATGIDPVALAEDERREAEAYLTARTVDLIGRLGVAPAAIDSGGSGAAPGASSVPSVQHEHPQGDAAEVIVERARAADADLIVMTTHGRTGLKRLVYGSVADAVLRTTPAPVLLVRVQQE